MALPRMLLQYLKQTRVARQERIDRLGRWCPVRRYMSVVDSSQAITSGGGNVSGRGALVCRGQIAAISYRMLDLVVLPPCPLIL